MRTGDVYFSELVAVYQHAYDVLREREVRLETNLIFVPRSTRPEELRNVEVHMIAWTGDRIAWSFDAPLYRPPRRQLHPVGRVLVHGLYRLSADLS